jgi:hypothetical protein
VVFFALAMRVGRIASQRMEKLVGKAGNGRASNASSPAKSKARSAAAARTYTRLVTGILAVSGQLCGLSVKGLAKWV